MNAIYSASSFESSELTIKLLFSETPVPSSPQLTTHTQDKSASLRLHTQTHQNSGFKPPSRELISMHNNDVRVNTILQMSICGGDKKRQSPVAFSGIASHLFTPQHLFHYQARRPIIRPDREQAVNQRFTLLCPISYSWWILMATYLALRWWTAGSCLLKLRWRPSVSHCVTNCLRGENSQGRNFAFGRRRGGNGRVHHRNNLNLETEAVWKP